MPDRPRPPVRPPWLLAAALCLAGTAGAAPLQQQARAFAADGGAPLYGEIHWTGLDRPDGLTRLVLYTCADGRAFARKQLWRRGDPAAPDFQFDDARSGYREGVRGADAREVFVRAGTTAPTTVRPLQVPADGVIDAGFVEAVRQHWPALAAGRAVRFGVLVPSMQRFVPVKLEPVGAQVWHGQPAHRLRMTLDQWFGFAVPATSLVFSGDGERLLEFAGTGNVRDRRGRNPQVRIVFPQPPLPAADGDAFARDLVRPLVADCGP